MTLINRLLYRLLRRLSAGAFNFAHGLQWLSLKAYDKSNFGAHRAKRANSKRYFSNWAGYLYDYLSLKLRTLIQKVKKS